METVLNKGGVKVEDFAASLKDQMNHQIRAISCCNRAYMSKLSLTSKVPKIMASNPKLNGIWDIMSGTLEVEEVATPSFGI